jgi:MFS family permease
MPMVLKMPCSNAFDKRLKMGDIIVAPIGLVSPYLSIYILHTVTLLKDAFHQRPYVHVFEQLLWLFGMVAIYLLGWVVGPIYAGTVMARWLVGSEKERKAFIWAFGILIGAACFLFWHSHWADWCRL